MVNPSVRLGIIGAGYWGSNLVRVCSELGVLDSVCDADAATRDAVKGSYPQVEVLDNLGALLARDINAAVVATPAQTHAEVTIAALRAGKHVFVEKPLALSVADAERVAVAAQTEERVVFVGHLLLYHAGVRKLKELLDDGKIGRVWHLRSRRLSLGKLRNHETVWWSFAPHDVALMLSIMHGEPESVVAAQASRIGGLSDVAYADFTFSKGRTAHIEVCWLDPEKSARLDVFGDQGVVTLNDSRSGSVLWMKRFEVGVDTSGKPTVSRGEETRIEFEAEEPLVAEMRAFAECVRMQKPSETNVRQGIAVIRTLAMADRALALRSEVAVPA